MCRILHALHPVAGFGSSCSCRRPLFLANMQPFASLTAEHNSIFSTPPFFSALFMTVVEVIV